MDFKEPFKVYTAASNVEAHQIVDMLGANGVPALADEDQSGVSLWSFGRISQFHLPNVWIEKSAAPQAAELIRRFEEDKRHLATSGAPDAQILIACEECGQTSIFPERLKGSTQDCSHCGAFMDIGAVEWDEDVGEPEE